MKSFDLAFKKEARSRRRIFFGVLKNHIVSIVSIEGDVTCLFSFRKSDEDLKKKPATGEEIFLGF